MLYKTIISVLHIILVAYFCSSFFYCITKNPPRGASVSSLHPSLFLRQHNGKHFTIAHKKYSSANISGWFWMVSGNEVPTVGSIDPNLTLRLPLQHSSQERGPRIFVINRTEKELRTPSAHGGGMMANRRSTSSLVRPFTLTRTERWTRRRRGREGSAPRLDGLFPAFPPERPALVEANAPPRLSDPLERRTRRGCTG